MSATESKTVSEFEVISHGIDYPDYFTGCGVSFTRFTDCVTGCGVCEAQALDDAIEQLACGGVWNVDDLDARILAEYGKASRSTIPPQYGDDAYYYVSIRVK